MLFALTSAFRHAVYSLRGGFLVRPLAIAFVLGACGILLPWGEQVFGVFAHVLGSGVRFLSEDSSTTQGALATISGAVMTVVSIVLSVLLVALTLASMQFSPRILTGFVEDRVSQRTIGMFLGTFLLLPGASRRPRRLPPSVVPVAVLGATGLAAACSRLVIFIHHIARSINVNYITERIAR